MREVSSTCVFCEPVEFFQLGVTWEPKLRTCSCFAMRFSHLATLLVLLLGSFAEIPQEQGTEVQEDCAGVGNIACAARLFHLRAARRDVTFLKYEPLCLVASFKKSLLFYIVAVGWCLLVFFASGEIQPLDGLANCSWVLGSSTGGVLQAKRNKRTSTYMIGKKGLRKFQRSKPRTSLQWLLTVFFLYHKSDPIAWIHVQVRSLKEGCLWWIGPPCSTWIFLARGSTGRSFTRARGLDNALTVEVNFRFPNLSQWHLIALSGVQLPRRFEEA